MKEKNIKIGIGYFFVQKIYDDCGDCQVEYGTLAAIRIYYSSTVALKNSYIFRSFSGEDITVNEEAVFSSEAKALNYARKKAHSF